MDIINAFENQLRKDVEDDNINGSISAAITQGDKIIWANSFGPSTVKGERAANIDTIYRVGSVAKSFTAFLMMQLVQEGIIDLDEPIENQLPEIQELEGYSDSTRITFRQIASHTAGLQREPKLEKANSGPIEEWEMKVLRSIPTTGFETKPGDKFSYSNIGYGLLGVALSRAANKPFIELMDEKILGPLRMNNSYFIVPDHKMNALAQGIGGGPFGEEELDLEGPKNEHRGRGYKVPNGGLYSTPTDLGIFLINCTGYTKLLSGKYLLLMRNNHNPEANNQGYGLGFEIYQDRSISIIGHSGGVLGYSSYFGFEKDHHYGVVLLRNYNWGTTNWDVDPKILLRKLADSEKKK
jgi:CubicO group peptidase (beta-lactamase class C family)